MKIGNNNSNSNDDVDIITLHLSKAYQSFNNNIIGNAFVFKNALNISLVFSIKAATAINYLITIPILRYRYYYYYY